EKRETEARSRDIECETSNYFMRLEDGREYNVEEIKYPLIHKGKGRPPTKCLKPFNETNNKAASSKMSKINIIKEVDRMDAVGEVGV
ncbi:14992_t:CDS:1, partial [Funneliformis geosporum]